MHLLLAARKAAGNRKSYARCTIYASRSRYNNHRVVIIPPDFNASFARCAQSETYAHHTGDRGGSGTRPDEQQL